MTKRHGSKDLEQVFPGPYNIIQGDEVDLNSSTIKEKINESNMLEEMIPLNVLRYIRDNSLYN